ncbi:MAG: hypothetical protein ACLU3F_15190 [Blautia wexlerae]
MQMLGHSARLTACGFCPGSRSSARRISLPDAGVEPVIFRLSAAGQVVGSASPHHLLSTFSAKPKKSRTGRTVPSSSVMRPVKRPEDLMLVGEHYARAHGERAAVEHGGEVLCRTRLSSLVEDPGLHEVLKAVLSSMGISNLTSLELVDPAVIEQHAFRLRRVASGVAEAVADVPKPNGVAVELCPPRGAPPQYQVL